jgi:branched-chain amino acid transport system ATP-binding protein
VLEVAGLSRAFGGVYATHNVDMRVADGELRGVIGPNGAGKSTLFGLIGGHLRASSGTISFGGARVDKMPVHRRARLGIATVFQGARLFPGMSVLENVMVGATAVTHAGAVAAALRLPSQRTEERRIVQAAQESLSRVGLASWAARDVDALPLGQQRRVQVARALAGHPKLLLLDEPASGLRAEERQNLSDLVAELHAERITIMLIEHDVTMVMRLAQRITVLDLGEVIADGAPDEVRKNQRVIDAYLGTEADHADTR